MDEEDLADDEEEITAIQQAIDDLEQGETGVPFADFDRAFRARHHLK